jgi:hypothetical protein
VWWVILLITTIVLIVYNLQDLKSIEQFSIFMVYWWIYTIIYPNIIDYRVGYTLCSQKSLTKANIIQLFVLYNYSFFFPADLLEKVSITDTKICVMDTEKFILRRKLNASCPVHSEKNKCTDKSFECGDKQLFWKEW